MTVFTPVYCCTDKVPVCYTRVDGADYITFSWNSAFWIFNWVANMVYPRYDLMMGDVRATQTELETTFNEAQEGVEAAAAKLLEKDPAKAKAFLTNYTNMTAQSTFDTWKRLGEFLVVKYNDGVVKRMKNGQFERNSIGQPAGVIRQDTRRSSSKSMLSRRETDIKCLNKIRIFELILLHLCLTKSLY